MKKLFAIGFLIFSLSACDYQSRADFEKEISKTNVSSDDVEMPEITYVRDGKRDDLSTTNTDEFETDFKDMYGIGQIGTKLNPEDALGNLIETRLSNTEYSISLTNSIQRQGGYSTVLSYKKDDSIVEREFGPVAGFPDINTVVTYDEVSTESGPMLLVSQITIEENASFSVYYLFNRYMGLVDYMLFRNSTEDTNPVVERLGDIIEWTDRPRPGNIRQAIEMRMEAEKNHLPNLFEVYGIKRRPYTSRIGENEMDIGYLPDVSPENRVLIAKTNQNPVNPGMKLDIK